MSNTHLSENPTYIIGIQPIGNHLQLTIPELWIVLETAPGKTKRHNAREMALTAISDCQQKQDEAVKVKVSYDSSDFHMIHYDRAFFQEALQCA